MRLLNLVILSFVFCLCACKVPQSTRLIDSADKQLTQDVLNNEFRKIPILNFGTFHMGFTTDENTTEFNEHDKENQSKVHEIARKLALFKPTVILVERIPKDNKEIQSEYEKYLDNPKMFFKRPTEIELLAYELGRISGTKRIYGIDHKMGYNYKIGNEIENKIDSTWHDKFYANPYQFYPQVNLNLYYQRNLRMYSNLNRIKLNEEDRIFILMGASHTAFFRDFISRSPKYEMVNSFDYLK